MLLPQDAILDREKFQEYLLKKLPDNDKSGFLALAGYTAGNWDVLREDIRRQLLPRDAKLSRETPFGNLYEIHGVLHGPNGKQLNVISVWMIETGTNRSKFITLYPKRGK